MSTVHLDIKTFESFSGPVVEFKKRIYDQDGKPLLISPGKVNPYEKGGNSLSINIHEIDTGNDSKALLRDITESISIDVTPDWINKVSFENKLPDILNTDEEGNQVLALAVRLVCPKINFVIESLNISLADIYTNKPIRFKPFSLDDVVGKVELQSELLRVKSSNPSKPTVAFSSYTILSKNKPVSFYIDEIDDVGGNFLALIPSDDLRDRIFEFQDKNIGGSEIPKLLYNKQFKKFFNNGDNYKTVQAIMILIGLPYCERILQWAIFGKPNFDRKDHASAMKFIAEICDFKESDLETIWKLDDARRKDEYLKYSGRLFENIQSLGSGWRKMLYQIVQDEKRTDFELQ